MINVANRATFVKLAANEVQIVNTNYSISYIFDKNIFINHSGDTSILTQEQLQPI